LASTFAQLSQLKARYVGDWKPNWCDFKEEKYSIVAEKNELRIHSYALNKQYLAFPTPELAGKFLKNFALLIKQYYGIK